MRSPTKAVVTGAASGLGLAVVAELIARGAEVVGLDLPGEARAEAVSSVGGQFVACDVTDRAAWQHAATEVAARLGRVSLVALNAGVMTRLPSEPLDDDLVELIGSDGYPRVLAVNVDGVVFGVQALRSLIEPGGVVAVAASVAGLTELSFDPFYAMTKHALVGSCVRWSRRCSATTSGSTPSAPMASTRPSSPTGCARSCRWSPSTRTVTPPGRSWVVVPSATQAHPTGEVTRHHARALDVDVVDATWAAIEPLLPEVVDEHPLGCHRARVPDRLCFWGILAGVFEQLKSESLAAFDRIIGLDLAEVSVDGSLHKAPHGGEETRPNPTDRGRLGWKWSVASERHGVPIGWTLDGANGHDVRMLVPTIGAIAVSGLHLDIDTVHLDRGHDYPVVRESLAGRARRSLPPTPRHQGFKRLPSSSTARANSTARRRNSGG